MENKLKLLNWPQCCFKPLPIRAPSVTC